MKGYTLFIHSQLVITMKKSLITLITLTGMASAATLSTINTEDSNLLSYIDFNNSQTPIIVDTLTYSNFASVSTNGYGIVRGGDTNGDNMYTSNLEGKSVSTSAFTFSFDVRSFGTGDLASLTVNNGDDWKKVMLTSTSSSNLELTFYGAGGNTILTQDTGITPNSSRDTWSTITLVGNSILLPGDTNKSVVVQLYVDGESKGLVNMTAAGATNWTDDYTLNGLQFCGSYGGLGTLKDFNGTAEIDNVLFYNRALSAAEVKALTIPEPTSAALSLFALAGLAMRRRRK